MRNKANLSNEHNAWYTGAMITFNVTDAAKRRTILLCEFIYGMFLQNKAKFPK